MAVIGTLNRPGVTKREEGRKLVMRQKNHVLSFLLIAITLAITATARADDGAGVGSDGPVPEYSGAGDVLRSIPAPGTGDPRGLTFDGTDLWVADNDTKTMYRLDPVTGAILSSFPTPGLSYAEGVAWDGTFLWHAEYDGNLYQFLPNGTLVGTGSAPTSKPTGLTWDGTYLWTADYQADMIYQFDTSGAVVHSFPSPTPNPWGVAWCSGSLWTSASVDNMYIKVNPTTGAVIESFPAPAGAWPLGQDCQSANLLWSVGNHNNLIYLIDLGVLFTDGFESGDTSAWSQTVP